MNCLKYSYNFSRLAAMQHLTNLVDLIKMTVRRCWPSRWLVGRLYIVYQRIFLTRTPKVRRHKLKCSQDWDIVVWQLKRTTCSCNISFD